MTGIFETLKSCEKQVRQVFFHLPVKFQKGRLGHYSHYKIDIVHINYIYSHYD